MDANGQVYWLEENPPEEDLERYLKAQAEEKLSLVKEILGEKESKVPRFELVELEDLKGRIPTDEYEEYGDYSEWREPELLWDNEKNEVAFLSSPEPEDASLARDFRPLINLLNEVSEEANGGE